MSVCGAVVCVQRSVKSSALTSMSILRMSTRRSWRRSSSTIIGSVLNGLAITGFILAVSPYWWYWTYAGLSEELP